MPVLRPLQRGLREPLPGHHPHLQLRRPRRHRHLRGLLEQRGGARAVRGPVPGRHAAGPGRAAAVRRHHRVHPHEVPRAQRAGEARRRVGPGRARPRRGEVRQGARDEGDGDQLVAGEEAGGPGAARR
uniref:Uncharacterized protein n=1 Tax=Arundo donax TaxID=35708 RepID=A0A0A9GT90_ARUDO